MVAVRGAHARTDRAVLVVEHADCLDRLHPLRRRHRLARARQFVAAIESARVRVPGARLDPAVARVRILQPLHSQLALHRAAGNFALRMFGYAWSFATIWPAIFEGAELVAVWGGRGRTVPAQADSPCTSPCSLPPVLPVPPSCPRDRRRRERCWCGPSSCRRPSRVYLAAPVWLGFIFLLDPINAALGGESLLDDLRAGRRDRLINLALSGLLCGVLWEFWNYWARAKWHYTRADHGGPEALRNAAARLSRLSGVRARVLHHVRVRPRTCCVRLDRMPARGPAGPIAL